MQRVLVWLPLVLLFPATRSAAQSGPLRVYGVGVPSEATSRWGSRNTVIVNVRVRNDSSDPVPGLVRIELEGVRTSSASPITTFPAGNVTLVPVSVDVDLTGISSGGDRLPFRVVLLNARREEVSRFNGTLAVRPVAAAPLSVTPDLGRRLGVSRDIAVERVGYFGPRNSRGAGFVVQVKNRGRERWAYIGRLGGEVGVGTPETRLTRSDRLTLTEAPIPAGLAPGDSADLWLGLTPVPIRGPAGGTLLAPAELPVELWVTVRVFVASSYDVNPANDALYYVLRLSPDHRVAESRTLPAPPLSVQVIPK